MHRWLNISEPTTRDKAGNDLGTTRAGGHERRACHIVWNLEDVAYHRERRHEALFADHGETPEDYSYCYDEQCPAEHRP